MTIARIWKWAAKFSFIFLFPLAGLGQHSIVGRVLDSHSHEPLFLVHIFFSDETNKRIWGTVTDYDGNFTLEIPVGRIGDTLHLSHVGYKPIIVKTDSIRNLTTTIFHMVEDVKYLHSITAHPLEAKEYILKCIQKREDNYFNISFMNEGFFWQWIKENDRFKYLSQSYLSIAESLTSVSMKLDVKEDSVISNDLHYNLSFLDKVDNALVFDIVRKGSNFVNVENINEWDFQFDNNSAIGKNYVVINAIRLDKFTTLKLLINDSNYAIEQVDYEYNWNGDQYHNLNDSLLYQMSKLRGKIMYKENGSKYYLQFMQNHVKYSAYWKLTRLKESEREIENEFVVFSSTDTKSDKLGGATGPKRGAFGKSGIIVNKSSFCEAAAALNYHNQFCNHE